jgi:hypothetical protein
MGRGGDFEGGGLRARGVTSSKKDDGRSGVKAIRIGNRVIDVSEFADRHPGGKVIEYYLNQVDTRTHTHTHTPSTPSTSTLPISARLQIKMHATAAFHSHSFVCKEILGSG